jgi:iron complex outermembrane recepter protein
MSPSLRQDRQQRRRQLRIATSVTAAVMTALHGSPAVADNDDLQEVVVTATKRALSAQNVPISITAITGMNLEKEGIEDIAALGRSMAGVNVTDKGPFGGVNGSTLIIRGLNSEPTGGNVALATPVVPPVATYVDDTPLFFNLRLQDLDHVEILRGPQGTLYGSGSLGGTIRFVQNAPDTTGFDARAELGLSDTRHSHAPNEDVSGMLNLPVSNTFAVRVNASRTYDAGFINQPNLYALDSSGAPKAAEAGNLLSAPVVLSKDGANSYEYTSARIAALWRPNDDFHAQLSYFHQLSTADGFPFSSPLYGSHSLSSSDNTQDSTRDTVDLVALAAEYELGFATLTSDTSWARHINRTNDDLTDEFKNFSFYSSLYGANPRALFTADDGLNDRPWSEELRLVSKPGGTFDWVAGLFFKNQTTNIQEHDFGPGYDDYFNACAPIYGVSNGDGVTPSQCGVGEWFSVVSPNPIDGIPLVKDLAYVGDFETHFRDLAAFGELTWHLTSAWTLTGGTRVFKQTVSQAQQTGLLFDGPDYIANLSLSDSWRRALWKVNTACQLDNSNLLYATWSQGFRRGGVNAIPTAEPAVNYVTPPGIFKVQPDTADNYEIGVKGTLKNRLRYSAAIYDIQWHNVQEGTYLTPLVLPGAINVGNAYSRGLETELYANLSDHLAAQVNYTFDQTKITSFSALALEALSVPPPAVGSSLPGTPKSSVALGLEYGHVQFAGGELRYSINGHYQSTIIPALSATVPSVPGYITLDTRASFTRSHWVTTVYIDNLTNALGISSYTDPSIYGKYYQAVVSRPRTLGVTVGYSFKER